MFYEFPVANESNIIINLENVAYIRKSYYDHSKTVMCFVGNDKNTVEVNMKYSDVLNLLKGKE